MTKTVAELLREAAAALEHHQVPSSNTSVATPYAPERSNNARGKFSKITCICQIDEIHC